MKLNPNLATSDELMQLNGVGPRLAERIIAERPYTALADLTRVSGIGTSSLQQWQDQLVFDMEIERAPEAPALLEEQIIPEPETIPAEIEADIFPLLEEPIEEQIAPVIPTNSQMTADQPAPAEEAIPVEIEANAFPLLEEPVEEQTPPAIPAEPERTADEVPPQPEPAAPAAAPKPEKRSFTRGQTWLLTGAAAVVTLLLAVGIVLGLFAWLNDGRLRFAAPDRVETLAQTLSTLEAGLTAQQTELETLTTRVDTLETLDDRMLAAEENIETLSDDLDDAAQQLAALESELDGLQDEVEVLQTQSETFSTFFESLRNLLLDLFPILP